MLFSRSSRLNPKQRYLQIALNSTLDEARAIIAALPASERILIEAGTPLIKQYGAMAISQLATWYGQKVANPYVVADLKMMDRGETEAEMAAAAGASAAVALGSAPVESLNEFIGRCGALGLDAMVDMMNVEYPLEVLSRLKTQPAVVILHRGADEERLNKEKMLPLYEIRRIKGRYNIMIAVAGGDQLREIQSAVFNDADIVVAWKSFFASTAETGRLAEQFLKIVQ